VIDKTSNRSTRPRPRMIPRRTLPSWERRLLTCLVAASAALLAVALLGGLARAQADAVAYLVNVTVRPGYNFAYAELALAHRNSICDQISQGSQYSDIIGDVDADLATGDTYQASHLVGQAVNELCPALIWQLRNSATGYRSPVQ
jgi:hypothetical protein